jgi:predicted hydrocarbon binding protein
MKLKGLLKLYALSKELKIDPDEGVIKSRDGIRYLLFSDDSVLAIEDDLEKIVGRSVAKGLTYRIGFEAGVRVAKPFRERFEGKSSLGVARRCADFAQIAGWGRHVIFGSLDEGNATVVVYNSPVSLLKKDAGFPVCNFHAGLLAGSASIILGKKIVCEEVNCRARGDNFCRFKLKLEENK